jgi:hypothetical protein
MTAGQEFTTAMDLRQIIGEMVASLGAPRSASEWEDILTVPVLAKLERDGLDFLKANGLLELFESSKRFPGFNDVQASWREAVRSYYARPLVSAIMSASNPVERAKQLFLVLFERIDPRIVLVQQAAVVAFAAINGDLGFFDRIASARRNLARRRPGASLREAILSNWLHRFLWLLSHDDRALFIQRAGFKMERDPAEAVRKASARLKLKGWSDWPDDYRQRPPLFLTAYSGHQGKISIQDEWTHLVPNLSS